MSKPESNIENDCILEIYSDLRLRYSLMAKGSEYEEKICQMMDAVLNNCLSWPADKAGRWVGYVQCLLIDVMRVTSTIDERNYTRPLFHKLYGIQGIEIPETISIE
jgi:hypothetical protein